MFHTTIASPIGWLRLEASRDALTAIHLGATPERAAESPLLRAAAKQIAEYFSGDLKHFDVPLAPSASPRGEALRAAISAIGPGEVAGYGAIARMIGSSPRAIGQACRRNPFPIVVPCHRVVGAGGAIGHYSAGDGVATKRWLLAHERGEDEWANS